MNTAIAEKFAKDKMREHGLTAKGWTFAFDRASRRFGVCYHSLRRITISEKLTLLNDEDKVFDTILHEIAHAMIPQRNGHNKLWRETALSIGCNGERTYGHEVVQPPKKFIGTCPNGHIHLKNRRTNCSCGKCSPVFNREFILTWERNPEAI